jgi:predicted RNA-binding Zn-ribbon protein involved in translation (DUF1610 family)
MENKTEVSCPNCQQVVRIPTGKHIKFTCPNCAQELEIDGRIKSGKEKSSYMWLYSSLISVALFAGYKYYQKSQKAEEKAMDVHTILRGNEEAQPAENQESQKQLAEHFDKNLKDLVDAIDVKNAVTTDFAAQLAAQYPGNYNIGQVCNIYDYVVHEWKYVNDTRGMENVRSASRTINLNLTGDCDDFAVLIAALLEGIGGKTRISYAYNDSNGHAFTEVYAARNRKEMQTVVDNINQLYGTKQFLIHFSEDEDGSCWLNLDWFGSPRHPGGKYFDYKWRTIYYPTNDKPSYVTEEL